MANEELIALSEVKKKLTAIRQYFTGYPSTEQDKLARSVVKLCMEEVGKINPADAAPVVHGRWEDVKETEMYVPGEKFTITKTAETCSACKARIGFVGAKRYLFDAICPNCGAKMDGERKDNEFCVFY